jgi:hypothetical protein
MVQQIIEKLSRFNRISVPLTEPLNIQWYDANPFAVGIYPNGHNNIPSHYFSFYILYGEFVYGSKKNTVLGITKIKEFHFMYSFLYRHLLDCNKIWTNSSFDDVVSFFDAVPNDLTLCLNIHWAKPLIELACKTIKQ